MISMDNEYMTRDGRNVTLYTIKGVGKYPIHGSVDGEIATWKKDGGWFETDSHPSDLVKKKVMIKRTVWINVYEGKNEGMYHISRELADTHVLKNRLACIELEIDCEVGEGLDNKNKGGLI